MGIPRPKKKKVRADWKVHHVAIRTAFLALLKEKKKSGDIFPPTNKDIAEVTGFTELTVSKHMDSIDMEKIISGSSLKLLLEPILMSMAGCAMNGDHKCAEVFINNVFGSKNVNRIDITSKGEKLPEKAGDTFQILVPEWEQKINEMNAKLRDGTARARESEDSSTEQPVDQVEDRAPLE